MTVRARCPECSHVFTAGKKMKAGGGGLKGAAYERSICTRLSLWVSNMTRQDLFWRSAMSGGRANLRQRRKRRGEFSAHAGDLVATRAQGRDLLRIFLVDGKWLSDFGMESSPFAVKGRILLEWEEVRATARKFDRLPMMVAKRNRRGECVFVTARGRRILERGVRPGRTLVPTLHLPRAGAWVYLFRDVLTQVSFDRMRTALRPVKRVRL